MMILLLSLGALAADPPAQRFQGSAQLDPALLIAAALRHPRIQAREHQSEVRRLHLLHERMSPIRGLTVGTGIQPGPDQMMQVNGQLWLNLNVVELVTYPNRIRTAATHWRAASAEMDALRLDVGREVRTTWQDLVLAEEAVKWAQRRVQSTESSHTVATERFLARDLQLAELTYHEGLLHSAAGNLLKQQSAVNHLVNELEYLIDDTLEGAWQAQQQQDEP